MGRKEERGRRRQGGRQVGSVCVQEDAQAASVPCLSLNVMSFCFSFLLSQPAFSATYSMENGREESRRDIECHIYVLEQRSCSAAGNICKRRRKGGGSEMQTHL